ncbi:hypothetical protein ECTT12B_2259, partial [Escherichia coli TT12B]
MKQVADVAVKLYIQWLG